MPKCQNCGAHVTESYNRVFSIDEGEGPRACPHCEDLIRRGSEIGERRG